MTVYRCEIRLERERNMEPYVTRVEPVFVVTGLADTDVSTTRHAHFEAFQAALDQVLKVIGAPADGIDIIREVVERFEAIQPARTG